ERRERLAGVATHQEIRARNARQSALCVSGIDADDLYPEKADAALPPRRHQDERGRCLARQVDLVVVASWNFDVAREGLAQRAYQQWKREAFGEILRPDDPHLAGL